MAWIDLIFGIQTPHRVGKHGVKSDISYHQPLTDARPSATGTLDQHGRAYIKVCISASRTIQKEFDTAF